MATESFPNTILFPDKCSYFIIIPYDLREEFLGYLGNDIRITLFSYNFNDIEISFEKTHIDGHLIRFILRVNPKQLGDFLTWVDLPKNTMFEWQEFDLRTQYTYYITKNNANELNFFHITNWIGTQTNVDIAFNYTQSLMLVYKLTRIYRAYKKYLEILPEFRI